MKITTAAYSVDGELLPASEYDIISAFDCDFYHTSEHIVRGFWVRLDGCAVEPIYLTQQQLETISHDSAF